MAEVSKLLEKRWDRLISAQRGDNPRLFRESRDRKVNRAYSPHPSQLSGGAPLETLQSGTKCPNILYKKPPRLR